MSFPAKHNSQTATTPTVRMPTKVAVDGERLLTNATGTADQFRNLFYGLGSWWCRPPLPRDSGQGLA